VIFKKAQRTEKRRKEKQSKGSLVFIANLSGAQFHSEILKSECKKESHIGNEEGGKVVSERMKCR